MKKPLSFFWCTSILFAAILLLPSCYKKEVVEDNRTWNGDAPLKSQEDLNNFSNDYTEVTGKLQIGSDDGSSDITDLRPLGSITRVDDLDIRRNKNLKSLEGLNIEKVEGLVSILGNDGLNDMDGLEDLVSVKGGIIIDSNSSLQSLGGLSSLELVGGNLTVTNNKELNKNGYCVIKPLLSNSSVGGSVEISGNRDNPTVEGILEMDCNSDLFWVTDDNFRDYLKGIVANAFNTKNYLITTHSSLGNVTEIDVEKRKITSLSGIQFFTNVQELDCSENQITSLDISKNTALTDLDCSENQITSLDVSNNTNLKDLECYKNSLTSLDVSRLTQLIKLSVDHNIKCDPSIIALNPSDSKYWNGSDLVPYSPATDCSSSGSDFWVTDNNFRAYLKGIVPSAFTSNDYLVTNHSSLESVTEIDVDDQNIASLNGIQFFTNVQELDCSENQITSLDISNNTALKNLDCESNQLTSLDVSNNTALKNLDCESNQLTSLDVSKNTALEELDCYENQLTSLNVSNNTNLKDLECYKNSLTSLDVSGLTQLIKLSVDHNIKCDPSIIALNPSDSKYWNGSDLVPYSPAIDCSSSGSDFWVPDNNFRAYLKLVVPNAFTSNDHLITTHSSLGYVTEIDVDDQNIASLNGIQFFTNVQELDCSENKLTSLDVSKNKSLRELECHKNNLAGLDVSGLMLIKLYVDQNIKCEASIRRLNAPNSKYWNGSDLVPYSPAIDCSSSGSDFWVPDNNFRAYLKLVVPNAFTSNDHLITTHSSLGYVTEMDVERRSIASLDGVQFFTNVQKLDCSENQITSLDISKNTALWDLDCESNRITSLDISKNTALLELDCSKNQLTNLDVSKNTALLELDCESNQLTSLDVSKNTALKELDCSKNQLTNLDVSKNTKLTDLECYKNRLTSLDVSKLESLYELSVDQQIRCEPSIKARNPRESKYWNGNTLVDYSPRMEC